MNGHDAQTPQQDPRDEYRRWREACPVRRDGGQLHLYRHADVVQVAQDPQRFSSGVSRYLQLPNRLDGEAHARVRALTDPYLQGEDELHTVEQLARVVMAELLAELRLPAPVEAVAGLGAQYAVRVQSRWLGWDAALEPELLAWVERNRQATRAGHPSGTAEAARAFDDLIRRALEPHRAGGGQGVTARLLADRSLGRALRDEELVSILRNWTAGDLGSLALCTGVILHFLATHPEWQDRLRGGVAAPQMNLILDEILRIDDPFVSNRRRARADTALGGAAVHAGEVLHLNWTAANRDPAAFPDPDRFDPQAHAHANLVYGTGPHACPGRPLATLELRVLVEELLAATQRISLDPEATPSRETPPAGGYAQVFLRLE